MMNYDQIIAKVIKEDGVEHSTMMNTPCLRYKGKFIAMIFEREDALIIKVSSERVNEIILEGKGNEFNFTKKRFKEWVLIPVDYTDEYESYIYESLNYARINL